MTIGRDRISANAFSSGQDDVHERIAAIFTKSWRHRVCRL